MDAQSCMRMHTHTLLMCSNYTRLPIDHLHCHCLHSTLPSSILFTLRYNCTSLQSTTTLCSQITNFPFMSICDQNNVVVFDYKGLMRHIPGIRMMMLKLSADCFPDMAVRISSISEVTSCCLCLFFSAFLPPSLDRTVPYHVMSSNFIFSHAPSYFIASYRHYNFILFNRICA